MLKPVLKPVPPSSRLNLHLALHVPRRVSSASTVEFLGKTWKISPTHHKNVTIVHHPGRRFWVIPQTTDLSKWPDVLGSYSLKSVFSF